MRTYAKYWLPVLILVALLGLAFYTSFGAGGEKQEQASSSNTSQKATHGSMDHSSGSMGAGEMLMENGEYSDERFIDAMIPHHQGAIEMAQVALENAVHPEILDLAEEIVAAQQTEIGQLRSIRQEQFGTSEVSMDMSAEEMKAMGIDPEELANQEPFDEAFIDDMIPHHESAIEMAQVVLEESKNPELRKIAGAIVDAQEREIEQMRSWRDEWYPEG
jgi:uncharacterized protein (DUF305 family)